MNLAKTQQPKNEDLEYRKQWGFHLKRKKKKSPLMMPICSGFSTKVKGVSLPNIMAPSVSLFLAKRRNTYASRPDVPADQARTYSKKLSRSTKDRKKKD